MPIQIKLLRALEQGEVLPVGSSQPHPAQFRVIAATHKNLMDLVQRGEFRHDLYFRLTAFEIKLPSLRSRKEDIVPLAEYFLSEHSAKTGRPLRFTSPAKEFLLEQPWYGNVRELRNAIDHAVILARQGAISIEHFPTRFSESPFISENESSTDPEFDLEKAVLAWVADRMKDCGDQGDLHEELLRIVERPLFQALLNKFNGQCLSASKVLGIHRTTLRKKLDAYGMDSNKD